MKNRPTERRVHVGDELSLDVESLADGPDAFCRIGKYVVFVAGALPGEKVRVRITSAAKKFGRGDLLSIEKRSPDRVGPKCEHFLDCGGCHFQHLAYPKQLEHKTNRLAKTLGFALQASSLPILDMQGPEDPWGQRNKIALHVQGRRGEARAGLFRMHSREVVPIRECPVQDPEGTRLAMQTATLANDEGIEPWHASDDTGVLRAIVVRAAKSTSQANVTLVARRRVPRIDKLIPRIRRAGASGIAVNTNEREGPMLMGPRTELVDGAARLSETIGGITYLSSPGAFFQTSAWGAAFLAKRVVELVDSPDNARVIDLYSGGGLLSLALAKRAREVIGIEENESATGDAVASARANKIANAHFVAGRAESHIHALGRERHPFAVVLDPPREGCDPAVIDAVSALGPERVVYVSCEPAALGRDLSLFLARGWSLERVEPLDMFPHAYHVESIAVLSRE